MNNFLVFNIYYFVLEIKILIFSLKIIYLSKKIILKYTFKKREKN